MKKRKLTGSVELRDAGDGLKSIVGYAAVFYRADDPGTEFTLWPGATERIMPGAFDSFRTDDVRALFNHEKSQVLGRQKAGTLRLEVDQHGLRYEITPNDSRIYRDVVGMLERGDVDGSSFQFFVKDDEWRSLDNGDEVRELRSVQLLDVGPVTFPAYEASNSEAASAEARDAYESYRERQREREEQEEKRRKILREIELKRLALNGRS